MLTEPLGHVQSIGSTLTQPTATSVTPSGFGRWRGLAWPGLAKTGIPTDRHMLSEQADVLEVFAEKGDLEPIRGWNGLLCEKGLVVH